jgi:hypothetical protein
MCLLKVHLTKALVFLDSRRCLNSFCFRLRTFDVLNGAHLKKTPSPNGLIMWTLISSHLSGRGMKPSWGVLRHFIASRGVGNGGLPVLAKVDKGVWTPVTTGSI